MDKINQMKLYEQLDPEVYDELMTLIQNFGSEQYRKGYRQGADIDELYSEEKK